VNATFQPSQFLKMGEQPFENVLGKNTVLSRNILRQNAPLPTFHILLLA
jgi:hypothetical protein